jgi:protein SHQ1
VHINPYYLRLNFSHALRTLEDVEDDTSSAKYDAGSGYLTVTLTKEVTGQEFKDLDLLAKLLAPRPSSSIAPTIEVISSDGTAEDVGDDLANHVGQLSMSDQEILEGTLILIRVNQHYLFQNISC